MQKKIHFIGYGNMAKAIINGLISANQYQLSASAPSLDFDSQIQNIQTFNSNVEGSKEADVVILCVKPAQCIEVLDEIKPHFNRLIISIAAGIELGTLNKHAHENQPLIRAMPNTPAQIGLSATTLIANQACNLDHKALCQTLFETIGITEWIEDETLMHAITALFGSGPAYFFLLQEVLQELAENQGISKIAAANLTKQTALGAAKLAYKQEAKTLRRRVTSAKGTTEAALNSLKKNHFESIIAEAINDAILRSKELNNNEEY